MSTVIIGYKNHKGETYQREISPIRYLNDSTPWYPNNELKVEAFDHGKRDIRIFAAENVIKWRGVNPDGSFGISRTDPDSIAEAIRSFPYPVSRNLGDEKKG
jgi:predicted DNA-binding transcriptional regulator YafY